MAIYLGVTLRALDFSPVKGPEGNIEYLIYLEKDGNGEPRKELPEEFEQKIGEIVKTAHETLD